MHDCSKTRWVLAQRPTRVPGRTKAASAVLGLFAVLCLLTPAHAAIPPGYKASYTYTGHPTTHLQQPVRVPGGFTYPVTEKAGPPLFVRFLFGDDLPRNATLDLFASGPLLLNAAISFDQLTFFSIYDVQSGFTRGGAVWGRLLTDDTGQIVAWRFGLGMGNPSVTSSWDSSSLPGPDVTDVRSNWFSDEPLPHKQFNTDMPGVWVSALIVPEPVGWMMILAGLPVVGGAAACGRRRRVGKTGNGL